MCYSTPVWPQPAPVPWPPSAAAAVDDDVAGRCGYGRAAHAWSTAAEGRIEVLCGGRAVAVVAAVAAASATVPASVAESAVAAAAGGAGAVAVAAAAAAAAAVASERHGCLSLQIPNGVSVSWPGQSAHPACMKETKITPPGLDQSTLSFPTSLIFQLPPSAHKSSAIYTDGRMLVDTKNHS